MKPSDMALSIIYFLCDLLILNFVLIGVLYFYHGEFSFSSEAPNMVSLSLMWNLCASINKVYLLHFHNSFRLRIRNYLKSYFEFTGAVSIIYVMFRLPDYMKDVLIIFMIGFPLINLVVNYVLFKILGKVRADGKNVRKALILGAGKAGVNIYNHFISNTDFGYKIIGFLDDNPNHSEVRNMVIGSLSNLEEVLKTEYIDEIIIAIPLACQKEIKKIKETADYHGVRLVLVPDFYYLVGKDYSITRFGRTPIINVREVSLDRLYNSIFKRAFDFIFSSLVLLMLSPLLLILAMAVKLDSSGPVFYCPVRIGRSGKKFRVFKFRSMYVSDNAATVTRSTIKNDSRITPIGKFLRKYSLDELPQFLNVLIGEMSVIGPRPHRVFLNGVMQKQVNNYMLRHYLKPGISGWAQVNGWRGPTDTEEQRNQRTSHDLWYINNWSPALDFKIIYLTLFGEKTYEVAF